MSNNTIMPDNNYYRRPSHRLATYAVASLSAYPTDEDTILQYASSSPTRRHDRVLYEGDGTIEKEYNYHDDDDDSTTTTVHPVIQVGRRRSIWRDDQDDDARSVSSISCVSHVKHATMTVPDNISGIYSAPHEETTEQDDDDDAASASAGSNIEHDVETVETPPRPARRKVKRRGAKHKQQAAAATTTPPFLALPLRRKDQTVADWVQACFAAQQHRKTKGLACIGGGRPPRPQDNALVARSSSQQQKAIDVEQWCDDADAVTTLDGKLVGLPGPASRDQPSITMSADDFSFPVSVLPDGVGATRDINHDQRNAGDEGDNAKDLEAADPITAAARQHFCVVMSALTAALLLALMALAAAGVGIHRRRAGGGNVALPPNNTQGRSNDSATTVSPKRDWTPRISVTPSPTASLAPTQAPSMMLSDLPSAVPSLVPTFAPTRLESYLQQVLNTTAPEYWTLLEESDDGAPRIHAWQWLVAQQYASNASFSEQRILQRYALATLYFSTNGDQWTQHQGWPDSSDELLHECEWWYQSADYSGPACDDDGYLIRLNLARNELLGTIPPELSLLSPVLVAMNLNENELQGSIPSSFAQMTSLASLSLGFNDLDGTLPNELGSGMSSLEWLFVYNNPRLTGTISLSFGSNGKLKMLNVAKSSLTGTVPETLCGASLLQLWADCNEIQCPCCTMCCDDAEFCSKADNA